MQQTDIDPRAEAVGNALVMFLEYLTNLGSRELDTEKRGEGILSDLRKQSQEKWIKPLEKQGAQQTGDERKWTEDRIKEIQAVLDEWFDFKSEGARRTHQQARNKILNPTKRESIKARLTHGVGSRER